LSGYLFAVTAANSFHNHGAWDCGDHRPARGNGVSAHPDEVMDGRVVAAPDGRSAAVARSSGPLAACADSACAVCHFLLLKLIPVRPVESIHVQALRETAVAAQPLAAARPPLLLQRSRAPPPVA
jgi:hypothetical protein